jgi:hypothetical protein
MKMNEQKIKEIRESNLNNTEIAKKYSVSRSTVNRIKKYSSYTGSIKTLEGVTYIKYKNVEYPKPCIVCDCLINREDRHDRYFISRDRYAFTCYNCLMKRFEEFKVKIKELLNER